VGAKFEKNLGDKPKGGQENGDSKDSSPCSFLVVVAWFFSGFRAGGTGVDPR
jgi:hypothetical protein